MSPEEKVRLTHIAEAAVLIARYLEGVSKQEFLEDTLRQDHDYDGVNIGRVWDTAIEDIPVLRAAAQKYLKLGRSEIAKPMNKIGSRSLCALVVGRISVAGEDHNPTNLQKRFNNIISTIEPAEE